MDLSLRFRQFQRWPFLAYKLCKKFNPDAYLHDGMQFVQMPAELLDQGLGAPLLRLVRRAGATDGQRLAFLCSDPAQQALPVAFEASAAYSLPVERAFAETKRSEAPRLCHVATASRNQILRQLLRQRSDALRQAEVAAAALHKRMKANISAPSLGDKSCFVGGCTWQAGRIRSHEGIHCSEHRQASR